jgi:tRNA (Thr-GGU) A37 N-methylase
MEIKMIINMTVKITVMEAGYKDGVASPLNLRRVVFLDDDLLGQDLTERIETEDQIKESIQDFEKKNKVKLMYGFIVTETRIKKEIEVADQIKEAVRDFEKKNKVKMIYRFIIPEDELQEREGKNV